LKPEFQILQGDAISRLKTLKTESVHCVVTSPPYWGLRDYGIAPSVWDRDLICAHEWGDAIPGNNRGGSGTPTDKNNRGEGYLGDEDRGCYCLACGAWRGVFGMEPTPDLYVEHAVNVVREVRRVLREDGTLWLNLGDSYARNGGKQGGGNRELMHLEGVQRRMGKIPQNGYGLKVKDLVGIPWRVAFALQADGWYLRSDIIWHKPNPMPESVTDRPTKAHEYLFLLTKSERYYYDSEAIAEPSVSDHSSGNGYKRDARLSYQDGRGARGNDEPWVPKGKHSLTAAQSSGRRITESVARARAEGANHDNPFGSTRNKRTVWTINTEPYREAHFAVFPPALIEPCILACPEKGIVLDPFSGSGTTGVVALRHNRQYIGIELNPEYVEMSRYRILNDAPLINQDLSEGNLKPATVSGPLFDVVDDPEINPFAVNCVVDL